MLGFVVLYHGCPHTLFQAPHIVQLASEITATSSGLIAVKY